MTATATDPAQRTHTNPLQKKFTAALELQKQGRNHQALKIYQDVLALYPNSPQAMFCYGLALLEVDKPAAATDWISRAISREPQTAGFHYHLGRALLLQKRIPAAKERFLATLKLDPRHPQAYFQLGDLAMDQGELEEAMTHFAQAISQAPNFGAAWINLGLCHKARMDLDQALACLDQGIAAEPENAVAHVNRAMTLLMAGRYREGWQAYKWRFQLPELQNKHPSPKTLPPLWDGSPQPEKKLLLLAEQGYGDNLQFIRYLPLVKSRMGKIILALPAPLIPLYQEMAGIDQLEKMAGIADSEAAKGCDFHIPLLSLPQLFDTTLETIPQTVPYLHAPSRVVEKWQERLGDPDFFKVGLVWEGKPLHKNDPLRRRSCTLADLAPLGQIKGVRFFSLQKGEATQQLKQPPQGMEITNLDQELSDFAETAGVIHHLDLVITIDTSVAHLAGGLGARVWTMLPQAADWRWYPKGEKSPWYPTMRLFWNGSPQDWQPLTQHLAQTLQELVNQHRSGEL
ncbi:MAG: glycosyltransferase family protein [Magnetococcales bacterium]|nr:glycosyltransferase family protein [Magnetococcales bacterium]